MKKIMFSALACIAFAFSGFASNEVVNEKQVSNGNSSELINQITAEEIFDEEFERVCVKFTENYQTVTGETKSRSVTICSYHHTYEQIVESITALHEKGVNIFA